MGSYADNGFLLTSIILCVISAIYLIIRYAKIGMKVCFIIFIPILKLIQIIGNSLQKIKEQNLKSQRQLHTQNLNQEGMLNSNIDKSTSEVEGKQDATIADYTKTITLNPQDTDAYKLRGRAYLKQEKYDLAIADFAQAIALNPQDSITYKWGGKAYLEQGKYDLAITAFTQTITLNPQDAVTYNLRGKAYFEQGKYDLAVTDYTQAITLDPHDADFYYSRGNVYKKLAKYELAKSDYAQAIALNPTLEEFLGEQSSDENKVKQEKVDTVVKNNVQEEETDYYSQGYSFFNEGNYGAAIAEFTQAINLNPQNALAYFNRGCVYHEQGKYNLKMASNDRGMFGAAINDYTQAITFNPQFVEAYRNRGIAYADQGKYDLAIADYKQAITLNPQDALAYFNRGNAYGKKRKQKLAIADYTQAIKINPHDTSAYLNRGCAYYNTVSWNNKYDKSAKRDWKKVLELDPTGAGQSAKYNLEFGKIDIISMYNPAKYNLELVKSSIISIIPRTIHLVIGLLLFYYSLQFVIKEDYKWGTFILIQAIICSTLALRVREPFSSRMRLLGIPLVLSWIGEAVIIEGVSDGNADFIVFGVFILIVPTFLGWIILFGKMNVKQPISTESGPLALCEIAKMEKEQRKKIRRNDNYDKEDYKFTGQDREKAVELDPTCFTEQTAKHYMNEHGFYGSGTSEKKELTDKKSSTKYRRSADKKASVKYQLEWSEGYQLIYDIFIGRIARKMGANKFIIFLILSIPVGIIFMIIMSYEDHQSISSHIFLAPILGFCVLIGLYIGFWALVTFTTPIWVRIIGYPCPKCKKWRGKCIKQELLNTHEETTAGLENETENVHIRGNPYLGVRDRSETRETGRRIKKIYNVVVEDYRIYYMCKQCNNEWNDDGSQEKSKSLMSSEYV